MQLSLILCSDMHMDIEKANRLLSRTSIPYELCLDYTEADIVIIITCAFGNKRNYSMFVIADVMKNAKEGSLIIATGCLVKLNASELKAIPNLEVKSFEEVLAMLSKTSGSIPKKPEYKINQNKVIISNGCLKKCSYCVYPLLEEKYESKPMENILAEIEKMCPSEPVIYITGAHETSDYGIDLYGCRKFAELLDKICTKFPNCNYVIGWFHPVGLTDDVIDVIVKYRNIVQIMVHIQHNDNDILREMHRPCFEFTENRIQKLHLARPDLSISTELIVGFPGETEDKFGNLVRYMCKNRNIFTDIGVASYEPVLYTKAAQLSNLPEYHVRNQRMEIIQEQFNATGYPAPPQDFKPLLSIYFEACYLLSRLPRMCINAHSRYIYPYISGTDTEFKLDFLVNFSSFTVQMLQDIAECNEKYTPEFRKWLLQIINTASNE